MGGLQRPDRVRDNLLWHRVHVKREGTGAGGIIRGVYFNRGRRRGIKQGKGLLWGELHIKLLCVHRADALSHTHTSDTSPHTYTRTHTHTPTIKELKCLSCTLYFYERADYY